MPLSLFEPKAQIGATPSGSRRFEAPRQPKSHMDSTRDSWEAAIFDNPPTLLPSDLKGAALAIFTELKAKGKNPIAHELRVNDKSYPAILADGSGTDDGRGFEQISIVYVFSPRGWLMAEGETPDSPQIYWR